jgi:amidohydrolase
MSALTRSIINQPLEFDPKLAFERLATEVVGVESLQRRLHNQPRLSGNEADTLATLMDELPGTFEKETLNGNIGVVRFGGTGRSVALRAEMDALPIIEQTNLPWASTNGAMHACGHDVHMAAFIAVARTVATITPLPAPLVGILQPREELGDSGARDVLHAGVLKTQEVGAIIGAHLQPALDSLDYSCTPGPVNAAADEFKLTVTGEASHGAYPHHSSDVLLAVSAFVVSCQQIVARNMDPTMSAVLTVGTINGGGSPNAIPGEATVTGTIRTMSEHQREVVHTRLQQVASGVATAHGCTVRLELSKGEPILENNQALALEIGRQLGLLGHGMREFRSYGADDFSFYTSAVPGAMIFTGTQGPCGKLHSSTFTPDGGAVHRVAVAMLSGYFASAKTLADGHANKG